MMDSLISRQAAIDALCKDSCGSEWCGVSCQEVVVIENLPSAQTEVAKDTNVLNNDCISRQAAIDALIEQMPSPFTADGSHPADEEIFRVQETYADCIETIKLLPAVQLQTEWNNHTVACLLAELFGDACACNYNGIDEWLPEKCEVIDACPNPVGVACWEQFLKHRAERRTDEPDKQAD